MPVYFNFTSDDAVVTDLQTGLSGTEIQAVETWQDTALNYDFSFHETHESGHPVYVCKSSGHGQRNMPKVDLKGKDATQVGMVNQNKLSKKQREDALAVITANLAEFKKLARNYYEGVPEIGEEEPVSVKCSNCDREIGWVALNNSGKRVCPKCKKWN